MISKREWHVRDKWKRHVGLAGHREIVRYLPPTRILNRESLTAYLRRYRTVYLKPVYGSFGNNIIKVSRSSQGYSVHREKRREQVAARDIAGKVHQHTRGQRYMIQRGIQLLKIGGRPVDYRVLLLKPGNTWEVMGIMGKIAEGSRIVTNYNHGGQPIRFKDSLRRAGWSEEESERMETGMKVLGMTAATLFSRKYKHCRRLGVDVAIDTNKRMWILEVNTNPFYELFRHHENKQLYGRIGRSMRRIRSMQSQT